MTTIVSCSLETPVGIEAKVEFLKHSDAFLDGSAQIKVVETHMSWVFLTDHFAYKLKKPVRSGFVDFRTIEARRRDCEAEVLAQPAPGAGSVPWNSSHDGGF